MFSCQNTVHVLTILCLAGLLVSGWRIYRAGDVAEAHLRWI